MNTRNLENTKLENELAWTVASELASDPHELVEVVDHAFEIVDAWKAVSGAQSFLLPGLTKAAVGFFVFGNRRDATYAAKQANELYQVCLEEQEARAYFTKYAANGLQQKLQKIRKPKWSFDRAIKFITTQIHKDRAEEYFRKFLNNRRTLKVQANRQPSIDWIVLPDSHKDHDRALKMFDDLERGRVSNNRLISIHRDFETFWNKKPSK